MATSIRSRAELDELEDDHPVREHFETYEEYQRHQIAMSAETVADVGAAAGVAAHRSALPSRSRSDCSEQMV